jgi:hypothetical protein
LARPRGAPKRSHRRDNWSVALETGYLEWPAQYSPADSVRCVWVSRPKEGPGNRVLPDACMDIIWDGERLFVAGPDTGPVPVDVGPGAAFAGVRFRPGRLLRSCWTRASTWRTSGA